VQKALVEKPGVAAFFDMDGTLLSSNVIETYLWLRLRELSGTERFAELSRVAARVPSLIQAERRERSAFLRSVYRDYDGARLADLDAIADEYLADHVLARLSPAAVRRIREHRAAGHQTVLITGAVRPLTRPLMPLFDHIEAAELAVDDRGICTGYLASSPLVGESRAAWMESYAAEHGIDLKASFGYADSHSDLPLLAAVGNPVAVRPDVPLFRHARRSRWTIVDWTSSTSSTRTLNPAGGRA
jgi:HAD superfamily hydrolase (TIGR01490 family)